MAAVQHLQCGTRYLQDPDWIRLDGRSLKPSELHAGKAAAVGTFHPNQRRGGWGEEGITQRLSAEREVVQAGWRQG